MKRAITTAFRDCLQQTRRSLDFSRLYVWVRLGLTAVLLAIWSYNQWQDAERDTRVTRVERSLTGVRDTLSTYAAQSREQEREVQAVREQVQELALAGRRREQAVRELTELLRANGITEKEALKRIEKLNNTGLAQFFSTVPNE